ncbi:cupredoxin domain-containing protein [Microvirga guangxiensis]|uniref:cupredoxin domain-containing protein n=1 Tax=Microvirga guangxiensis TaxID=549386 RepID=UPI001FCDC4C4|nr:hypothetical protein [Microvirga guangxiensis]
MDQSRSGNSHTATAYHWKNFERPQRIPEGAEPWNSDYLLPNESFSVTLTVEGIYDFYCVQNEHAGMVGRINVGQPGRSSVYSVFTQAAGGEAIPEIALQAFPPVDEIMRQGIVRRTLGLIERRRGTILVFSDPMVIPKGLTKLRGGHHDPLGCLFKGGPGRHGRRRRLGDRRPAVDLGWCTFL